MGAYPASPADFSRLDAKRREQTPQSLARLTIIGLFVALWLVFWLARIPMPLPFLVALIIEAAFFVVYWRTVIRLPSIRSIERAHYLMLSAEIVFHTTMVYFLGGITWLGAFAYVFGLIFTNTFLDLRRGLVYTSGVAAAFSTLIILEAAGVVPHYAYLNQGPARYADTRFVLTTLVCATGAVFSIYLWVNWVGRQLRRERDAAVRAQDDLLLARAELQRANADLEHRVEERTTALQQSEALLKATIESTADGILVIDAGGRVVYANSRFSEMWRIPDELLRAKDDAALLSHAMEQVRDPENFIAKVRELYQTMREDSDTLLLEDGRVFERYSRPLIRGAGPASRVWSFRDVTLQKLAEETLCEQATHDALTGAFNHGAITAALRDQVEAAAPFAVVMVDVDGMKAANDSYGHQVGDTVLKTVCAALSRRGAVVGRYGGDEFLAILPHAGRRSAEQYRDEVEAVLAATRLPSDEGGVVEAVAASLGIAVFPDDARGAAALVKLADTEMYAAKQERRRKRGDTPRRAA